jgi:hypothetical protein
MSKRLNAWFVLFQKLGAGDTADWLSRIVMAYAEFA